MDSVNSLLERRNQYIAEHPREPSNNDTENANSEVPELGDTGIFDGEANLSSNDIKLEDKETEADITEVKEEEDKTEESQKADEDGMVEIKINRNMPEKMSIFSNKTETSDDKSEFNILILKL